MISSERPDGRTGIEAYLIVRHGVRHPGLFVGRWGDVKWCRQLLRTGGEARKAIEGQQTELKLAIENRLFDWEATRGKLHQVNANDCYLEAVLVLVGILLLRDGRDSMQEPESGMTS